MKNFLTGILVAAFLATVAPLAWSALQEPGPAPPPTAVAWEYKVVGIAGIHGGTMDSLKKAWGEGLKDGLTGLAKEVDEELAAKTEAVLNKWGAEGWELEWYSINTLIFRRPGS